MTPNMTTSRPSAARFIIGAFRIGFLDSFEPIFYVDASEAGFRSDPAPGGAKRDAERPNCFPIRMVFVKATPRQGGTASLCPYEASLARLQIFSSSFSMCSSNGRGSWVARM